MFITSTVAWITHALVQLWQLLSLPGCEAIGSRCWSLTSRGRSWAGFDGPKLWLRLDRLPDGLVRYLTSSHEGCLHAARGES